MASLSSASPLSKHNHENNLPKMQHFISLFSSEMHRCLPLWPPAIKTPGASAVSSHSTPQYDAYFLSIEATSFSHNIFLWLEQIGVSLFFHHPVLPWCYSFLPLSNWIFLNPVPSLQTYLTDPHAQWNHPRNTSSRKGALLHPFMLSTGWLHY